MARVELVEGAAQRVVAARAARHGAADGLPQRGGQFGGVPSAKRQAAGQARVSGTCFEGVHPRFESPQPVMDGGVEPVTQPIDVSEEFVLAPDDQFRGRRRRRRAQVGREVGERDVGLVAHRGDDRHGRGRDRAHEDSPR